jgi:mRNA interferase MazF
MNDFKQFDIWLVNLNPTVGSEINKTRPCVIISPDEMNWLNTIIISPLTTKGFKTPTRVSFIFKGIENLVLLDQIRTIDKKRMIKKIGIVHLPTQKNISTILVEMFSLD